MASDNKMKVFTQSSLNKLIQSADNESKMVFENPDSEFSLAMFLLVRKAFNDAYDKVKEIITERGEEEIGTAFSGLTGDLIRGTHAERGGSKYQWSPTSGEEMNPDFVTEKVVYKVDSKAVDKYLRKYGELPPGIVQTARKKSLSLSPTKEAKTLFEQHQKDEQLAYEVDVLEIEE